MNEQQVQKAFENCASILQRKNISATDDTYLRLAMKALGRVGYSSIEFVSYINGYLVHESGYTEGPQVALDLSNNELLYANPGRSMKSREMDWMTKRSHEASRYGW